MIHETLKTERCARCFYFFWTYSTIQRSVTILLSYHCYFRGNLLAIITITYYCHVYIAISSMNFRLPLWRMMGSDELWRLHLKCLHFWVVGLQVTGVGRDGKLNHVSPATAPYQIWYEAIEFCFSILLLTKIYKQFKLPEIIRPSVNWMN